MAKKANTGKGNTEDRRMPPRPATPQLITDTIEKNYMPYVMSVIISRAIPEIDGFKPSQRKLLYTMYNMGLLSPSAKKTKSANIVGATMKLNPHGDMAIYETLVRLTRANEALLHPFVDSKGSFGKQYSSDMAFAAPRYTEVKLDGFCREIFDGIDKDAVEFVPNYDNSTTEPTLLPTKFPNILVSPNLGIAVGMACNICSFNLAEICDAATAMLKNPKTTTDRLLDIIKAPDFSGGAQIIYDREQMREIYETGRGSVRMRARYRFDKDANCIEVLQIPYSTTIEQIMKKMVELVKDNKLKEVVDFRDEIDLSGFKLTIDLRRGTDPDKLMAKLYKLTPLEDSFKCNFNLLIDGAPRQIGIAEILTEWIRFRLGCYRREITFVRAKKAEKLHLLLGLGKILLDIDRAIKIVRETEKETDVVKNLMTAFSIDEIQADYIAEIKLRHLNREYILNRIREIEDLQKEIAGYDELLADELKQKAKIAEQLAEIKKTYGIPRRTQLIHASDIEEVSVETFVENYNVKVLMTREGYFKKITLVSLRGNDEQLLKDGDEVVNIEDADNRGELLFFTDKAQVYKAKIADFDTVKASALGDYLPAKLGMEPNEKPILMKVENEYSEKNNIVYIFANGKGVRVPVTCYQTKTNRKKLSPAYSSASPIVNAFYESEPFDILLVNSANKAIMLSTKIIPQKSTRTANGVQLFTIKKGQTVTAAYRDFEGKFEETGRYRKIKIPAAGILLLEKDMDKCQLRFTD